MIGLNQTVFKCIVSDIISEDIYFCNFLLIHQGELIKKREVFSARTYSF